MITSDQMMHRGGVLVIDDNPAICDDFRKILQGDFRAASFHEARAGLFADAPPDRARERVEVHCADQGQIGLEMVQSALQRGSPYAVAFVDMLMPPGWDGIETIDHLWRVDPELEIVICTAFSNLIRDRLPLRYNHGDKLLILLKPFDEIEVWQLVHALTLKGHLAQQAKQQINAFIERVEQSTQELREVRERLQTEMTQRQQIAETLARHARDLARLQADLQQVADAVARDL